MTNGLSTSGLFSLNKSQSPQLTDGEHGKVGSLVDMSQFSLEKNLSKVSKDLPKTIATSFMDHLLIPDKKNAETSSPTAPRGKKHLCQLVAIQPGG